jgi:hypothetical protein
VRIRSAAHYSFAMRGTGRAVGFALSVAIAGASALAPVAAATQSRPGISHYSATVKVLAGGSLHVAETVTYDFHGVATNEVDRVITTREHYDATSDRIYNLTAVKVDAGHTDVTTEVTSSDRSDTLVLHFASPQKAKVMVRFDYQVAGAVAATADGLEARWPVVQGFGLPITDATVEWDAPSVLWLSCLAGSPGTGKPCTTAQLMEVSRPTMRQRGLRPGDQMVGILGLSSTSGVAADADLQARWSLARSFTARGAPLEGALGLLALGLLAAAWLWWSRGRDSRPEQGAFTSPLRDAGEGHLTFAPPSGIRPGQMGTLVDERADLVDIAATMIDLAVRRYLYVQELPTSGYGLRDWVLHRRNEHGEDLRPYEREVLTALFGDRGQVRVSELGDELRSRLPSIQSLMYDDMVAQGWFGERPDAARGRWSTAGWVLVIAGVVVTVVLALVSTFGLVGLAVVLAGAALAAVGQLAPARTSRGGRVLNELRAFRHYLETADVADMPSAQSEELISRLFPYALVFGLGERWANALAALDADPTPDEPIFWYGAPSDWHLSDAAHSLLQLSSALSTALASRRLLAL